MFTLLILFSNERIEYLKNSIELFKETNGYECCEKILIVDGKLNHNIDEFLIEEVHRKNKYFCWADSINRGVDLASNDIIFYFDCDRIVPVNYFQEAIKVLKNKNVFVYAEMLYKIKRHMNCFELRKCRENLNLYHNDLSEDFRISDPLFLSRKNPFSGGVGFYKKKYVEMGGFDESFKGWGYPDYDFFMRVTKEDKNLLFPLNLIELHQYHCYEKSQYEVCLHNIWNANKYIKKFNLDEYLLDEIISKINLKFGTNIQKKWIKKSEDIDEFLNKCKYKLI